MVQSLHYLVVSGESTERIQLQVAILLEAENVEL